MHTQLSTGWVFYNINVIQSVEKFSYICFITNKWKKVFSIMDVAFICLKYNVERLT